MITKMTLLSQSSDLSNYIDAAGEHLITEFEHLNTVCKELGTYDIDYVDKLHLTSLLDQLRRNSLRYHTTLKNIQTLLRRIGENASK
jgi:hypothetical protein